VGRPPVNAEIAALVRGMAETHPLWGAPNPRRAHEARHRGGRADRLPAAPEAAHTAISGLSDILANDVRDLVSIDFFTVPTAGLRVLFVLVVLAHDRRRVVHFNVTEHPTADWTAQPIVEAFPDDTAPAYLLTIVTASPVTCFGTA
jgi:putative transposase